MPTPTKRDKIIERLNVTVLATAKNVLSDFQEKGGYASQSDSLNDLLLDYGKLQERVKELEAELAKLKGQLI
jgi:hypothetical protein